MLEAAEQGLGVTLGMSPLIKARPGFGKKLIAPFAFEAAHSETIYLVSRTEQARDRRIAAVRRWIVEAVGREIAREASSNRTPFDDDLWKPVPTFRILPGRHVRTSRTNSNRPCALEVPEVRRAGNDAREVKLFYVTCVMSA